ncbi:MAG: STAS domain-containing protein [Bacteroidales bacterium]|nr:STAS domain-containing protein [Bacteroidales bacterium]
MITFDWNNRDNELICKLSGKMSADISISVLNMIQAKIDEFSTAKNDMESLRIAFDLEQVDYIASSFIRICVATAKQMSPGNFRIINTSPLIKKTFKIAGLDEVLNVS